MNASHWSKPAAVVAAAVACWLVPLLWSLQRQRAGVASPRPKEDGPAPVQAAAVRPLILYVDAWPTRATLDLREIQGLTTESESTLAPAKVADHLVSALGRLGITPEIHRIDRLPPATDVSAYRPVVVVYPVRHGRPAAEVAAFFDRRVEPLVARQNGRADFAVADVAVAETPEIAAAAQRSVGEWSRYYKIRYEAGPRLDPRLSLHRERQLLAELAGRIRAEAGR